MATKDELYYKALDLLKNLISNPSISREEVKPPTSSNRSYRLKASLLTVKAIMYGQFPHNIIYLIQLFY